MSAETPLVEKTCVACESGDKPLSPTAAEAYLDMVPGWRLHANEPLRLVRKFKFKDFAGAMKFVERVAEVAESEGHHPDIRISWNRVTLELVTHAIGGLSENDFIMAAKINELEGA